MYLCECVCSVLYIIYIVLIVLSLPYIMYVLRYESVNLCRCLCCRIEQPFRLNFSPHGSDLENHGLALMEVILHIV